MITDYVGRYLNDKPLLITVDQRY